MSIVKFREDIAAGAYVQRTGTTASSFAGLDVSSNATLRQNLTLNLDFIGNARIRGIATINSGTTVVSVAATGVVSGDSILTSILQYASGQSSQAIVVTFASSVRTDAFEIRTVGSNAPVGGMPVAWFRIDF